MGSRVQVELFTPVVIVDSSDGDKERTETVGGWLLKWGEYR